jgi:hypothetical protein
MGHGGDAKIGEQYLLSLAHEHVLWLDIAVDELLLVGVLQGLSYLLDHRDNHLQRYQAAFGVPLS